MPLAHLFYCKNDAINVSTVTRVVVCALVGSFFKNALVGMWYFPFFASVFFPQKGASVALMYEQLVVG